LEHLVKELRVQTESYISSSAMTVLC